MLTRLLVPTDGSPASTTAARLAAFVGGAGATLTLFHVSSDTELVALAGLDATSTALAGVPAELVELRRHELEAEAAGIVARTRDALGPAGAHVETRTSHGSAGPATLAELATSAYDAAVLGTRGRGLLARMLLGSVSDTVLRGATRPVLVARHEAVARILVGLDGSPASFRAAGAAGALAARLGVPVELVCAVEFAIDTYVAHRAVLEAAFQRQADAHFAEARTLLPSPPAATRLVFHEAAHALTVDAERHGADLIVLGRQGTSPRFPLGSVAQRVATSAHASVLVVP